MRKLVFIGSFMLTLFLVVSSCAKKENTAKTNKSKSVNRTPIIDTLYVNSEKLEKKVVGGIRLYNGELFTGYATKYHENKQLAEKVFYINGRKEGVATYWFDNGKLKKTIAYQNNQLEGSTIAYFFSGKPSSIKNYSKNKLHGVQESWYRNGQLFKKQNYLKGRENGMQEAWMENGKKFINYEARNGRIFGLKRLNLCFGLENENIKKKK